MVGPPVVLVGVAERLEFPQLGLLMLRAVWEQAEQAEPAALAGHASGSHLPEQQQKHRENSETC
jgi:hypothetical protein